MELDMAYIRKLLKRWQRVVVKNWFRWLMYLLACIYLYAAIIGLTVYSSIGFRIVEEPLMLRFIFVLSGCWILYVLINHLLVKYVISHKSLIVYDALLLIILLSVPGYEAVGSCGKFFFFLWIDYCLPVLLPSF